MEEKERCWRGMVLDRCVQYADATQHSGMKICMGGWVCGARTSFGPSKRKLSWSVWCAWEFTSMLTGLKYWIAIFFEITKYILLKRQEKEGDSWRATAAHICTARSRAQSYCVLLDRCRHARSRGKWHWIFESVVGGNNMPKLKVKVRCKKLYAFPCAAIHRLHTWRNIQLQLIAVPHSPSALRFA